MESAVGDLIRVAEDGDGKAAEQLFAALYHELHDLAERQLGRSGPELTLGTTTLLHEAYLNIVSRTDLQFPDRARFLAYASRAMRGLVIDYGRSRRAKKRGGEFHITLSGDEDPPSPRSVLGEDLDQLSEALDRLAGIDAALAQLVDLHFFCGFSFVEIASLRDVSERTVQRDWRKARLLLHRELASTGDVRSSIH